jgi:protein phosphatase
VEWGSWTEVGRRQRNEDCIGVREELGLFAIADGMGGHSAGDEASREAIAVAVDLLANAPSPEAALSSAVLAAHTAVSSHNDNRGTTLTLVLVRDRIVRVAHVGDTRLYVNGSQITRDQGRGFLLDEFVGGESPPLIQEHAFALEESSWLLLSTDGIHDVLPVSFLFSSLAEACNGEPTLIARMLALVSLRAGSTDNCSAIVVRVYLGEGALAPTSSG